MSSCVSLSASHAKEGWLAGGDGEALHTHVTGKPTQRTHTDTRAQLLQR